MLFNSIEFLIFLPLVFLCYWGILGNNRKFQNIFLLLSSYIFYGWWDWRFLFLIFISTIVDYLVGLGFLNTSKAHKRKILLSLSILVNLGILGFFKYYDFFIESLVSAFAMMGVIFEVRSLHVILPVGISFYTFQTMSYSLDVYNQKLTPTKDFFAFSAYVSFFPQLVAGPIERATNLLPQFERNRNFEYSEAIDGVSQMAWGFLKKIVIADNCAIYANMIFSNSGNYGGSTILLGAIFFSFQIYGDFSGYSDIAIGTSKLFGFNLSKNFSYPYFSRNIAEFWRRWHISLTTWFRDYVYIPLGGSKGGKWKSVRNTIIIFLVSGLWHGANWTFIAWGLLNAVYFIPLLLFGNNRKYLSIVAEERHFPTFNEFIQMSLTFMLTVFAWILFRADNLRHAFSMYSTIFSTTLFEIPDFPTRMKAFEVLLLVFGFLIIEWQGRRSDFAIKIYHKRKNIYSWISILLISCFIFWFGNYGKEIEFIYFQF